MRDIKGVGPFADVVEAPSPENADMVVTFGIRVATFHQYSTRGLATAIAQYYGIVQGGMGCAKHLFQGLNRPLMLAEDTNADEPVLVYTWRSPVDFEWHGPHQGGYPVQMVPPDGRVFAVLVRREEPSASGLCGSIEKWNWIREDPKLCDAPEGWGRRYGKRLWSR
jgi:hypothetical protein